ncbi:MAG: hypothetical protein H0W08_15880 [Acidobacteria bacterium]|nr:hypothetical protein [Acidobacteriota bacterium]
MNRSAWALGLALGAAVSSGCSLKRMGLERMADAVSATADAFAHDDDPEFVRLGAPATLKMVEMLLDQAPAHPALLLTACSGFTQYAYAFLQVDAELIAPSNAAEARLLRGRATKMYERAREYCLRGLDAASPGTRAELLAGKLDRLGSIRKDDVGLLYWTAAAWGGLLAVAESPLIKVGEVPKVRALAERAIALDAGWEAGTLHELMIGIEGLPAIVGGSPQRARTHFDRAVTLSSGLSAFAYVTMATSGADPAETERLLKAALAIDVDRRPDIRLANIIAQKRARFLLARAARRS